MKTEMDAERNGGDSVATSQKHSNKAQGDYHAKIGALFIREFGYESTLLQQLIKDIYGLYSGNWPTHEACQVGYHTLEHIMEVAMAVVRMMIGWNRMHTGNQLLSEEVFLAGIVAALFHDCGYIKDKGDMIGSGGKLAFIHVERSKNIAKQYLLANNWSAFSVDLVPLIIEQTDFTKPVVLADKLSQFPGRELAGIVGTADLLAQMADVYYIERLPALFAEFHEAYQFEDAAVLLQKGIKKFDSVQEMIDGTVGFFEQFVTPRIEQLGRMDSYLGIFFGNRARNPYMESVITNLYRTVTDDSSIALERIGEKIKNAGLIGDDTLRNALQKQQNQRQETSNHVSLATTSAIEALIQSLCCPNGQDCLGSILLSMGEICSDDLQRIAAQHLLSSQQIEGLKSEVLLNLLRLGMMLSNIRRLPSALNQAMKHIVFMLECEVCALFIVHEEKASLTKVVSSDTDSQVGTDIIEIPWDKGVVGWVVHNKKPALIDNVSYDSRFTGNVSKISHQAPLSILAMPLINDGVVIGVIEAINKTTETKVFTDVDLKIMLIVAQQLANSIDTRLWMIEATLSLRDELVYE